MRLRHTETSLRERNKARKLGKISRAARALFIRRGYDATTLRQIAAKAGVGLGTLFSYAADKRDLLFLIINDDIEAMNARAFAEAPIDAPLLERLVAIFRVFFAFFGRQPNLSRIILKELTFYSAGPQARRFQGGRAQVLARLAELIGAAQRAGEIGSGEDAREIAYTVFSIYAAEIREWLGDAKPDLEAGFTALRRHFRLLLMGLGVR
ncbi:MAG TPA: TetR/AcrR family transcriptional regulator [Stellaceae bacterium]|nr:TetR/AcrR family transcriptional regulator [Stellaceae bacterium]